MSRESEAVPFVNINVFFLYESMFLTSWDQFSPGTGDGGQLVICFWLYNLMEKEDEVFITAVTKAHRWFPFISNSNTAHFGLGVVDYID